MKVVIMAGGMGTRISEESHLKPKPMIEIGEKPILWHIMKIYSYYGFNDFIICCGYKGHIIKEYFMNYYIHQSDVTFDLSNNTTEVHSNSSEPWKVTLVDTGLHTGTAGRIKMIQKYVKDEPFMMTYGDGVGDINVSELLEFHKTHGKIATITATRPSGKFGALQVGEEDSLVYSFMEKPKQDQVWINAGFAVLNKEIFNYINDPMEMLEMEPYEHLAKEGHMAAYKHNGFWQPMDTMRDKGYLESLIRSKEAPWMIW